VGSSVCKVEGNPYYYLGLVQEATRRNDEALASFRLAVAAKPYGSNAAAAKLGIAI
jgi:hypothetical protein